MFRKLLLTALLLLTACVPSAQAVQLPIKGYGLSPRGFPANYSQLPDFFAEVSSLPHGGVMFNGAWRGDVAGGRDAGQIPAPAALVMQQATSGYTPIIVFGWRSEDAVYLAVPNNPTNDWTNAEAAELFRQMLVDFAREYSPPYLFLGNENEGYYISNPQDYVNWIRFYEQAYAAIKAASPQTQIGPVFQYERLAGLGTFSGWSQPQWAALEAHDMSKVDILGLTVYPWLGVATPEEIPAGYLEPLRQHIGETPLAITETGWPGENLGVETAWEQSPQAQVRFVNSLVRMLQGFDVDMLNWLYIHPITGTQDSTLQTFGSVSLRDANGEKQPVYDLWVDYLPDFEQK